MEGKKEKNIEERLIKLWNRADKLSSNSQEYNEIVDEIIQLHDIVRKNNLHLSPEITARF